MAVKLQRPISQTLLAKGKRRARHGRRLALFLLAIGAVGAPAIGQRLADQARSMGAAPDRVTCRSSVAIGSIIARQLQCMTVAAWNKTIDGRREEDDFTREEALVLRAPEDPAILRTGTANWASLPPLPLRRRLPYVQLVAVVAETLRRKTCVLPGQRFSSFDIDVRFAVRLDGNGKVDQVVVGDSGCPAINELVALTVLARERRGDLASAGAQGSRWLGSAINFTLR